MQKPLKILALLLALTLAAGLPPALAQNQDQDQDPDRPVAGQAAGSSRGVEESDEAFRRRMELEDARSRDAGFTVPSTSSTEGLEKIDKLPQASRDNIRDQLVDIIMENGEWEPFDALREYPYEPTATAQAEPRLLEQEQEAWDEQIQKYHEREAAAYGAKRGPVPVPEPGEQGDGQVAGEQGGEGQNGESGSGESGSDGQAGQPASSGTYQPYEPNRKPTEEEVSTAGTQQSALDFLRGQPGQAQAEAQPQSEPQSEPEAAAESDPEPAPEPDRDLIIETRGIIAIEDLDKLEGAEAPQEPEDSPEDFEER